MKKTEDFSMSYELARAYLEAKQLADRITVHAEPSDTVAHAAQVCGCEEAQIAKTMSFLTKDGPILIVAAGDRKIQGAKFKAVFHEKAVMIPGDQVEGLIGHAPGGVCPFGCADAVRIFLDESIKRFDEIHIACGSDNATARLTPDELAAACPQSSWVDACKSILDA